MIKPKRWRLLLQTNSSEVYHYYDLDDSAVETLIFIEIASDAVTIVSRNHRPTPE